MRHTTEPSLKESNVFLMESVGLKILISYFQLRTNDVGADSGGGHRANTKYTRAPPSNNARTHPALTKSLESSAPMLTTVI